MPLLIADYDIREVIVCSGKSGSTLEHEGLGSFPGDVQVRSSSCRVHC